MRVINQNEYIYIYWLIKRSINRDVLAKHKSVEIKLCRVKTMSKEQEDQT